MNYEFPEVTFSVKLLRAKNSGPLANIKEKTLDDGRVWARAQIFKEKASHTEREKRKW